MQGECHPRERIDGDKDGICIVGTDMSDPPDWDCVDAAEQTTLRDCKDGDALIKPAAQEACLDGVDNDCDMRTDAMDSSCTDYRRRRRRRVLPQRRGPRRRRRVRHRGRSDVPALRLQGERPGDCARCRARTASTTRTTTATASRTARDESCGDYQDADGDGFCVVGRDTNADSLCDARNEQSAMGDCDEGRPNVFPGAPENCIDGRDNDCDDESDEAGACGSERDEDDDGYCPLGRDRNGDGDCLDRDEDESVSDCRDDDDETNPDATEDCKDLVDNDCDGSVDLVDDDCARLLDSDEDGYCEGGQDINGDHDCLDSEEESAFSDCLEGDPAVRPRAGEKCDDGIDNDCNGEPDGFDIECTCSQRQDVPVDEACLIGTCFRARRGVPGRHRSGLPDGRRRDGRRRCQHRDGAGSGCGRRGQGRGQRGRGQGPADARGRRLRLRRRPPRSSSGALPCALALGVALAWRLRKRGRSRRSAFIPDRS